jgi:hypothetical protein
MVQILAGTTTMAEVFCGFPWPFQVNAGIVL